MKIHFYIYTISLNKKSQIFDKILDSQGDALAPTDFLYHYHTSWKSSNHVKKELKFLVQLLLDS